MSEEIKFLKEYQKLCQKYKMGLWGCGCCDSPSLDNRNLNNEIDIRNINYDNKLNIVMVSGTPVDEL